MSENTIYCGDCLFVMKHDLLDRNLKVDLIYLDPPFFTGKTQGKKPKNERKEAELIRELVCDYDEEEKKFISDFGVYNRDDITKILKQMWNPAAMEVSFQDSKKFWGTKSYDNAPVWMRHIADDDKRIEFASYLWYMYERLEMCKKVLKDTGSIYLHCDEKASHYLKMIMDEVFGFENFRSEIIWCYTGPGSPNMKQFNRKHDTIFWYSNGKSWTFNKEDILLPYKGGSPHSGGFIEKDGMGINPEEYTKGKVPETWWADIAIAVRSSKERLGYPTQKPEALLERIIKASSNEGDLVLDPFCGCGTAIVTAHKLGRQWIGIDVNPLSCIVMKRRFRQPSVKPKISLRKYKVVMWLNQLTKSEFASKFEEWVNDFYRAKKPSPDRGIDGITPDGVPIQTKDFKVKYDVVAEFESNIQDHSEVPKPVTRGMIVSYEGFDEKAMSKVSQIERRGIKIELKTVEKMFEDAGADMKIEMGDYD